jgi:hypothetical protein
MPHPVTARPGTVRPFRPAAARSCGTDRKLLSWGRPRPAGFRRGPRGPWRGWRYGLRGDAAAEGDWHSNRAGRPHRADPGTGSEGRRCAGDGRLGARICRRVCDHADVQQQCSSGADDDGTRRRPPGNCRGAPGAGVRGDAGLLPAGAAGNWDRSYGSAARAMMPPTRLGIGARARARPDGPSANPVDAAGTPIPRYGDSTAT